MKLSMTAARLDQPRQRKQFQQRLLDWYDRHRRDLPWRRQPTLYRVWISEVMLQQTQVDTVLPYYRRFLKQFPNIKRLAESDIDAVLRCWEGLGYYRRARALHQAARIIRQEFGGRFPTDPIAVQALPGIGRYTANAILSIATDARLPILEGNTLRLLARLAGIDRNPRSTSTQRQLWEFSESLLPPQRCGDFNQALMELGSQLCTPEQPDCGRCPVQRYCHAYATDRVADLPRRDRPSGPTLLHESLFIIHRRGRLLLRQCADGERWEGLYDFPRLQGQAVQPGHQQLLEFLKRETELTIPPLQSPFRELVHHVTRYKIRLRMFQVQQPKGRLNQWSRYRWVPVEDLDAWPLNRTARDAYRHWLATE